MFKKTLFYIFLALLAGIYVPRAYAATPDPSSVVEIKVWDATIKDYAGNASGILLSDNQVLTDYHVAKFAIDNPKRYQLVICLSSKINTLPDCVYAASPASISGNQLSQDLDLALLDLTTKGAPALKIKGLKDWVAGDYSQARGIDLASYGTDISALKIKSGEVVKTLGYPRDTLTYSIGHVIGHQYYPGNNIVYVNIGAPLSSGSSGGGVFDQDGNFVGITPGGWLNGKGQSLQGYFIPVSSINWWLDYLRQQPKGSISQTELPIPDNNTVLKIQSELCKLGDENYCVPDKALSVGGVPTGQEQLTLSEPNQRAFTAPADSTSVASVKISQPSFFNKIINFLKGLFK